MTGTQKARGSLRFGRLAAGVVFLVGFVSANAAARPPVVIAPVTGFRPVPSVEPLRATEPVGVASESISRTPTPTRPSVVQPSPHLVVVPRPTAKPAKPATMQGSSIRGVASWFCKAGVSRCTRGYPPGSMVAAIRRDLLGHRGDYARVCVVGTTRCVTVRIVDCNCGPHANLIDLYWEPMRRLGGTGILPVTLTW